MNPRLVGAALQRLAGTGRLVVYDVAADSAPSRATISTPFVRGGDDWWRFVQRRRALDDGLDLNLLVSLRRLSPDERLLVVGWGTAFANSFLLVEPSDVSVNFTTQAGVTDFASANDLAEPEKLIRAAYAEWVYWVRDRGGDLESRTARLDVMNPNQTIWQTIWDQLPQTFDAAEFLSILTLLNLREPELFTGGREVARAIVPFLTRLGMPILYDARHVMQAMRQLINAGLASAQDPQENLRTYRGPGAPLPAEISDERLALMLR